MVKPQEELVAPVAAWAAWAPGVESPAAWSEWATAGKTIGGDGSPAVPFVDALMRRRLSRFARMALYVAHTGAGERTVDRLVFASRHGELQRTTNMLHDLVRGAELSPTDFSLSVHNAVAGVHSIVSRSRAPSVAVAAGEESFGYGLIEAVTQWRQDEARSVLFVYADESVPGEYRKFVSQNEQPHALALLIASPGERSISISRRSPSAEVVPTEMQSLAFLRSWTAQTSRGSWENRNSSWHWSAMPHVG